MAAGTEPLRPLRPLRWLRRFAVAAAVSGVLAALLATVAEPSLALVVGLAGAATGAVMAFGRRVDSASGPAEPPPEAGPGVAPPPAPRHPDQRRT